MTHLRTLAVGLGLFVMIAVSACGNCHECGQGGGATGSSDAACKATASAAGNLGTAMVMVAATDNLVFDPVSQSAHVGDVIEWKNTGTVLHNVMFANLSCLDDPNLTPGGVWQVKFTKAGTYNYACSIHAPSMIGSIKVT